MFNLSRRREVDAKLEVLRFGLVEHRRITAGRSRF